MRRILFFLLLLILVACQAEPTGPEPDLLVSNSSLEINTVKRVFDLTVRNIGEEDSVMEWNTERSSLALVIDPPNGRLERGESQIVKVSVNRGAVPIADRIEEEVVFESNGGDKSVFVTFSIEGTGLAACGTYPTSIRNPTEEPDEEGPTIPTPTPPPGGNPGLAAPYAPDELLIGYNADAGTDLETASLDPNRRMRSLAAAVGEDYGLLLKKSPSTVRPALVQIPIGEDPLDFAKRLAGDPRVDYAEPNYYLELQSTPNDEFYEEQWHLSNFGLPQAWDIETGEEKEGEEDVIIAVIDSGFDADHPDLGTEKHPENSKILPGCDFFDKDNDADPRTTDGGLGSLHGTHVAGIAAAIGDNRTGIAGVGYGAGIKILPVKVFSDQATGASLDIFIDSLLWLAGEDVEGAEPNPFPPKIINMSLGVRAEAVEGQLRSLERATDAVADADILMIAASGNNYIEGAGDENRILIPAADPNVLAVGSVDADYRRSGFSQFDANPGPNRPTVDIMAPGGYANVGRCSGLGILSTFKFDENSPQIYGCQAGTSMASPFVAGVAALLWSQNPDLSAAQVRERLLNSTLSADYMDSAAYGSGVLCADRALGAATLCGR